ncbi:MAG: hypothetical protein JNM86_08740 [Phycisphaerae bacterium]|nr:hypothetical protein [Phycisphaerae bacterium]
MPRFYAQPNRPLTTLRDFVRRPAHLRGTRVRLKQALLRHHKLAAASPGAITCTSISSPAGAAT